MSNKIFQTIIDCGFSKIRAGTFNINDSNEAFFADTGFLIDPSNLELKIQKIVTSLEKDSNEYIDNINLMIDSPKMFSIGISLSKKLDGSKLKQANIKFLIQEAKQQILKYLDIFFICLPNNLVLYYKNIFSKSNILINQIICTTYIKSINYKNNLNLNGNISFIDIGYNKTSIASYINDKIISLDVLPIGGNHITKDISKILEINLEQSEQIKINFYQNHELPYNINFSLDILQKIILARIEEIIRLFVKSIESNSFILADSKIILMGEGSKILDREHKDKIILPDGIKFLDETIKDICQCGFNLAMRLNKQEVVVVPKKQIKQGFFEKLFHLFR